LTDGSIPRFGPLLTVPLRWPDRTSSQHLKDLLDGNPPRNRQRSHRPTDVDGIASRLAAPLCSSSVVAGPRPVAVVPVGTLRTSNSAIALPQRFHRPLNARHA
jgi:hypothetical protein